MCKVPENVKIANPLISQEKAQMASSQHCTCSTTGPLLKMNSPWNYCPGTHNTYRETIKQTYKRQFMPFKLLLNRLIFQCDIQIDCILHYILYLFCFRGREGAVVLTHAILPGNRSSIIRHTHRTKHNAPTTSCSRQLLEFWPSRHAHIIWPQMRRLLLDKGTTTHDKTIMLTTKVHLCTVVKWTLPSAFLTKLMDTLCHHLNDSINNIILTVEWSVLKLENKYLQVYWKQSLRKVFQ